MGFDPDQGFIGCDDGFFDGYEGPIIGRYWSHVVSRVMPARLHGLFPLLECVPPQTTYRGWSQPGGRLHQWTPLGPERSDDLAKRRSADVPASSRIPGVSGSRQSRPTPAHPSRRSPTRDPPRPGHGKRSSPWTRAPPLVGTLGAEHLQELVNVLDLRRCQNHVSLLCARDPEGSHQLRFGWAEVIMRERGGAHIGRSPYFEIPISWSARARRDQRAVLPTTP